MSRTMSVVVATVDGGAIPVDKVASLRVADTQDLWLTGEGDEFLFVAARGEWSHVTRRVNT